MDLTDGLRRNFGLKLLSVALALLLWSFVHGSKTVDREMWLPVRYVNLPDSLMLLNDPPREARVQLSGPAQELAIRLRFFSAAELRIDLSRARAPLVRITPSASDVVVPSNSRLTPIHVLEPTVLELHLERRLERLLPVRVRWGGEPAAGYCLQDSPRAIPAMVRCSGAASAILSLVEVPTESIDLGRKRGAFTQRVELQYDRRRVQCDPEEVGIEVQVAKLRSRSLLDTPLTIVPASGGDLSVDIRPARASVTLSGPPANIDALDPRQVTLVVDVSGLRPGRYSHVRLMARLPRWARLDSLEPANVDVVIQKRSRR